MTDETQLGRAFALGVTATILNLDQSPDDAADETACADCACGLADGDIETEEYDLPLEETFGAELREYVLAEAGLDRDTTFLKRVEVCPDGVTAVVERRV